MEVRYFRSMTQHDLSHRLVSIRFLSFSQLESVLQQELESISAQQENGRLSPPNTLDLNLKNSKQQSNKGPSLPEPNCPPPPPPLNGVEIPTEPIYEAVLPRDEESSPPPLPAPPHKLRPKSPGIERIQKSEKASPVMNGSPRQSRPSSRGSNISAVSLKVLGHRCSCTETGAAK